MVDSPPNQTNQFNISHLFAVKWSNSSIWSWDWTLSGTNILIQSGPGINFNERVLKIPQRSRTGVSLSDGFVSYQGYSVVGVLTLCKDAVSVFYSPSQLGYIELGIRMLKIMLLNKDTWSSLHISAIFKRLFEYW